MKEILKLIIEKIDLKTAIIIILVAVSATLGILYTLKPSAGEGERDVWKEEKTKLEKQKKELEADYKEALKKAEQDSIALAEQVRLYQDLQIEHEKIKRKLAKSLADAKAQKEKYEEIKRKIEDLKNRPPKEGKSLLESIKNNTSE